MWFRHWILHPQYFEAKKRLFFFIQLIWKYITVEPLFIMEFTYSIVSYGYGALPINKLNVLNFMKKNCIFENIVDVTFIF